MSCPEPAVLVSSRAVLVFVFKAKFLSMKFHTVGLPGDNKVLVGQASPKKADNRGINMDPRWPSAHEPKLLPQLGGAGPWAEQVFFSLTLFPQHPSAPQSRAV